MAIHLLNCFTCSLHVPAHWQTGMLGLLVDTDQGPVLVDTGPGQDDYVHKTGIIRTLQTIMIVPMNPEEAAVYQVAQLGYKPEDVRNIVLTHMHFDHCGGLPDFPQATMHVHRREHEAFMGRRRRWTDLAYVRRHTAHQPEFILYDDVGESWFDFAAMRLPFEPEMWLVPLFGHSPGHCGVAIKTETSWMFHAGDAAPIGLGEYAPEWLVSFVLGPHSARLREFSAAHPEIRITTGHMWLDSFEDTQ